MINKNLLWLIIINILIRYDCMYVKRLRAIFIDRALYKYFYFCIIIICTSPLTDLFIDFLGEASTASIDTTHSLGNLFHYGNVI